MQQIKVKIVPQENSITIETFVKEYILYCHRCPRKIQTDERRPYVSQIIKEFLAENNIKYMVTAPYHLESNETMERVIGAIKNVIKKVQLRGQTLWNRVLYITVQAYQIFSHRAMGYSPFKMLYRREDIQSKKLPHIIYICDKT